MAGSNPGGVGVVLRFGLDGGVGLEPQNPYSSFKGHFGRKGYPLLRTFLEK